VHHVTGRNAHAIADIALPRRIAFIVRRLRAGMRPLRRSQAGMNICANEDYKAADAKLNKTYIEIMKRLSDDADGRKLLQAAQRSWIAFRDAECNFSTADSQGGSIHPMLVSGCLQGLTEARTEQLGSYLNCEEGDMSCPVPAE
jgi:uncharacterized protein YecT (DUF1311 family)